MICEILSIGTELLMGQVANTDARYLAERMAEMGFTVYRQTTVGDNPGRIKEALAQALARSDMVITTGGLGPTEDDLTKQMVAECLGLEMVRDERSLQGLRAHAQRHGYELSELSIKQADFPKGARIMPNRRGTAPGCIVEKGGKIIAVLPGPPMELTDMFEQQLEPYLMVKSEKRIESRFLKIFGMGEPQVHSELWDLFNLGTPTLALYCSAGEVTARITVQCGLAENPGRLLDPMESEIRRRLGNAVYAEGRRTGMAETVYNLLLSKGKMLALAESCTGGMLASMLTDVSGASKVLLQGHVTYNDRAKMRVLGVRSETLSTYGSVSAQCASEMAAGALLISETDYALSVTGFAGPEGGTEQKPVGTCYIGLADRTCVTATHFLFDNGDRTWIRTLCCQHALNLLRLKLLGL